MVVVLEKRKSVSRVLSEAKSFCLSDINCCSKLVKRMIWYLYLWTFHSKIICSRSKKLENVINLLLETY